VSARVKHLYAGIAGFALGWTPVFAPVHELGHILVAAATPSIEIVTIGWRFVEFMGPAPAVMYVAGFASMAAFGILLARTGPLELASCALGLVAAQPLYAAISTDYFQLAASFGVLEAVLWWTAFTAAVVAAWVPAARRIRIAESWRETRRMIEEAQASVAEARLYLRRSA
jgi:hypothetical protein